MGDFFSTALEFPAVILTFPLAVVILYWLVSLVFGVGGSLAEDAESGSGGHALGALGRGPVPLAVGVSLLIAVAWFFAMAAGALLDEPLHRTLALPGALLLGWAGAVLAQRPLGRLFPAATGTSREEFVGRVCTVRTSRVTAEFGQAEVVAEDGGAATIQVRAEGPEAEELRAGARALIFGYEPEGEFFWVAPYDAGPLPEPESRENRPPR